MTVRKLYIHQHANDLRGASVIKDEYGKSRYLLVGKWGIRQDVLSLYSMDGSLLAEVKQLSFGLLPKFSIYQDHQQVATVGKSLGFVREVIYIRGLNWIIVGNIISDSYKIFHGASLIFSLQPVKFSSGYYHELSVTEPEDEPVAILIASVLDHWARKGDRKTSRFRSPANNYNLQEDLSLKFKYKD